MCSSVFFISTHKKDTNCKKKITKKYDTGELQKSSADRQGDWAYKSHKKTKFSTQKVAKKYTNCKKKITKKKFVLKNCRN